MGQLSGLLTTLFHGNLGAFRFLLGERLVDVKIGVPAWEVTGLYSILHDEWRLQPDKLLTQGLIVDDIWFEYLRVRDEVDNYLREMQDKLKDKDNIYALEQYYRKLFRYGEPDIKYYIIHKLLSYSGVFKNIKEVVSTAWQTYFSLK